MVEAIASAGWLLLAGYLGIGVIASVVLHVVALARSDPAVRGAGVWFRVLITPGLLVLWPWLVLPSGERATRLPGARQRTLHRRITVTLAAVLPVLAGAALWFRPAELPVAPAVPIPREAPAAEILGRAGVDFSGIAATVTLGRSPGGAHKVGFDLTEDSTWPALILYWNPGGAAAPMREAVFLGRVRGPGSRWYALPAGAHPYRGAVVLQSLARRERLGAIDLADLGDAGH